ncbi:hypothetical protein AVEN_177442-1 [Araneus ventricosus]|uniref:Uncharacterized protein n=1 Tax=Araneus ventricosus TaxID=182803 RepID=A0A4Y2LD02_ARAVE|nr:hypothetical protein AVEN_177442-1 [Araneus ventricosus]
MCDSPGCAVAEAQWQPSPDFGSGRACNEGSRSRYRLMAPPVYPFFEDERMAKWKEVVLKVRNPLPPLQVLPVSVFPEFVFIPPCASFLRNAFSRRAWGTGDDCKQFLVRQNAGYIVGWDGNDVVDCVRGW